MTPGNIRRTKRKSNPKSSSTVPKDVFAHARKRLDEKRLLQKRKMQWAHFWNLCPKCGGDMFEQRALQICFDVCRDCHGIYLEASELNLAMKHLDPKIFLGTLSKKSKKPKVQP